MSGIRQVFSDAFGSRASIQGIERMWSWWELFVSTCFAAVFAAVIFATVFQP